jgi:hypothetical protein
MNLAINYELLEGSVLDTAEMVDVHCTAWINDDIWKPLMNGVPMEAQQAWLAKGFAKRNGMPDRKIFKVVERATGYILPYSS